MSDLLERVYVSVLGVRLAWTPTPMYTMPRGTRSTTPTTRTARGGFDTAAVVGHITELVPASETLRRQNAELTAEIQRLRSELVEIGSPSGASPVLPRGRSRRGAAAA